MATGETLGLDEFLGDDYAQIEKRHLALSEDIARRGLGPQVRSVPLGAAICGSLLRSGPQIRRPREVSLSGNRSGDPLKTNPGSVAGV